jgi:hypothetical protein
MQGISNTSGDVIIRGSCLVSTCGAFRAQQGSTPGRKFADKSLAARRAPMDTITSREKSRLWKSALRRGRSTYQSRLGARMSRQMCQLSCGRVPSCTHMESEHGISQKSLMLECSVCIGGHVHQVVVLPPASMSQKMTECSMGVSQGA